VTLTDLIRIMEAVTGRPALLRHSPAVQPGDLVGDNARMKEVLGVTPRTSLYDGLTAMVAEAVAAEEAS
jgi:nucleoside-diphosphate-sugar epimerase